MLLAAQHLQLQAQLSALLPTAVDCWLRCGAAAAGASYCYVQLLPQWHSLLLRMLQCQHLL
jgi:hypothetical protein